MALWYLRIAVLLLPGCFSATTTNVVAKNTFYFYSYQNDDCQKIKRSTHNSLYAFILKRAPRQHRRRSLQPSASPSITTSLYSTINDDEILWKLIVSPEASWQIKLAWQAQTKWTRMQQSQQQQQWVVLPPKSDKERIVMVLQAYWDQELIAKFGFTVHPGPPNPLVNDAVSELWPEFQPLPVNSGSNDAFVDIRAAAVIYMYVEPAYRQKRLGSVALQMMRMIHAIQQCHATILVADDNGSGKLVQWYQQPQQGNFQIVPPYLQEFLGNPNQQYGVAMMALTPSLTADGTANLPRVEWC